MAVFPGQADQQDPEAVRRAALLAAIMGRTPGMIGPPGTPGAPQPAQPGFAIPNPGDANQPTARVAQPTSSAKSPVAKPMTTPTTAIELGNQPPMPTFASEEEWSKANPPAPHTPYVEPDLKHRLLMGLFAGMTQFGRDPGAGERMLGSYLGDIEKNEELEKKYPENSAAAQHKRYMTAAQGAEAPAHLQELQAHIRETEASAAEKNAKAKLEANPAPKYQHIVVEDPTKPGTPKAALFDEKTGAYLDPDTQKAIPGAKPFEKPPEPRNLEKITVLGPDNKPHVYGVDATGKKVQDFSVAPQPDQAARHTASELAQVERETRTAIRKADADYRQAEGTANLQRNFIAEAKGENKETVKIVPLEGALEITTSQGVHRINRTEVEQYGSPGSILDHIIGKLHGAVQGQDIPDWVSDDMDKMTQQVIKNAQQRYSDTYDDEMGIAQGYGLALAKKMPKIKPSAGGNQGQAGALPPAWK